MPDPLTHSFDPAETAAPAGDTPPAGDAPAVPGYELLEEVGRGGMGVVYRARDLDLDREVAVKLLLPKYAPGSAVAARFVDEARITGQLQHPGIPAVYRVGALPDGRPFLAMKLVKGRTLAALLASEAREPGESATDEDSGGSRPPLARSGGPDARAASALDPLAVFEKVCEAVGYAHAHGVVHRDLKPQNVMVGAFGEVQVMDWGLAKVLAGGGRRAAEPADPEATTAPTEIRTPDSDGSLTRTGSILGTPAYMPPEQAAGELGRVGPRSDVFGLGAMLCALLTGEPPYDGANAEAVRVSAIRGRTEAAFARLDACGADPGVVALCKWCLAFEPADRPASADAVAAEVAGLRRAADDRAAAAGRDKLAADVRAAEQAKRRRATLWAAGAVAAVLLLGIVGTTIGLVRADIARRDAEGAREAEAGHRAAAEGKEREANATVTFFEDRVFAAARPKGQDGGLGKDVTLRAAVEAAVPALADGFPDQPLVEARLRRVLGVTFHYLGEDRAAAEQGERAAALSAARLGPDHPDALAGRYLQATGLRGAGRHHESAALFVALAADRERVLGPDHPDTLEARTGVALLYQDLGRLPEALALHGQTLAGCRRALGPDHPATLRSLNNAGFCLFAAGRYPEALDLHREALAAHRRLLGPDHPATCWDLHNVALCTAALGRTAEALERHREALAGRERVLGPDHPDTLWSRHNVAYCSAALDRHADALGVYREVAAAWGRVLGPEHPDTLQALWGEADALVELGRGAEAVPVIDRCVAGAVGKAVHPRMVPEVMALRLRHFRTAGDPAGCRTTAAMWEGLNRPGAEDLATAARIRAAAAGVSAGKGHPAEAGADADRAMEWLRKAVAAGLRDRGQADGPEFAAVRGRADYRALVEALPYLAPPPRLRP